MLMPSLYFPQTDNYAKDFIYLLEHYIITISVTGANKYFKDNKQEAFLLFSRMLYL